MNLNPMTEQKIKALQKAQIAAHTPEANAKRAASLAAKHAGKKKVTSIPLDAIPDDKPKVKPTKVKAKVKLETLDGLTRERAALEIMRLTMWLAQQ